MSVTGGRPRRCPSLQHKQCRALNVRIRKDADRDVDLTDAISFANRDRQHPYTGLEKINRTPSQK